MEDSISKHLYRPVGPKEWATMLCAKGLCYLADKWPDYFINPDATPTDLYASAMTPNFNKLHDLIYPRFFEKIAIESTHSDKIRELSKEAVIVYITKEMGQLEYNFFNYLLLNERLPLAKFVNELSLWQWLPFSQLRYIATERAKRFVKYGPLPNPVSSGYVKGLLEGGSSVFIQLRSTTIFDDLYWYENKADPLRVVIEAAQKDKRRIYLTPLDFLWNKRPEGSDGVIRNILPTRMRRLLSFWRNYKNRAVVKIGEPVDLTSFVAEAENIDLEKMTRGLRAKLLDTLHQEKKATTGPALKPRSWVIEQVLGDSELQKVAYEISAERNKPIDDVKALAKKYATEISADVRYNYIEAAQRIMKWALNNIFEGIVIGEEGLNKVKQVASKAPIILTPNHRSHMDYLLLSTILYDHNIAIPHVAGGINMSFWPMGHIFRRCGAYFIRRRFVGNKLYRATLKAYLKILLRQGYCQELFIEGGRTRTGKLLKPKTGMLSMLKEAMDEGAAGEAYFIPVAISYEQAIEEYNKEASGEAKRKERTLDLLRIRRFFRRKYGRIYVSFSEPIPYSEIAATCTKENAVQRMSEMIISSINREMVATPSAVAASALLLAERHGMTHDLFLKNCKEILKYLSYAGVKFSNALEHDTESALTIAVKQFAESKYIEIHDEFEPVFYEIRVSKRIGLDFYKNTIIAFLTPPAILASILAKQTPPEKIQETYLLCKQLFSYEFPQGGESDTTHEIEGIQNYFNSEDVLKNMPRLDVYKKSLTNYFEAYLVALMTCKGVNSAEERSLIKKMISLGRHLSLLGRVTRQEAISGPLFQSAILSLTSLGLLKKELDDKGRNIYSWTNKTDLFGKLKQELEELC